jgi:hypothetical protein
MATHTGLTANQITKAKSESNDNGNLNFPISFGLGKSQNVNRIKRAMTRTVKAY